MANKSSKYIKNEWFKNLKFLYSVIGILLLTIVLISGFIVIKDSSLIKNDTQKWSEFKLILVKDSQAFNEYTVKSIEVSKKHYPIIKNIDCQNIGNFKDISNCQTYKDITIKQIEKPDQVKKNVLAGSSEYEVSLSGAFTY